jgi:hypothetical protein
MRASQGGLLRSLAVQMNLSEKFDLLRRRQALGSDAVYALIDGNRMPRLCRAEAGVYCKGDSKEFSITAASSFANSRSIDACPPARALQHSVFWRDFPACHMAAVRQLALPIHRRTFCSLKHMEFDDDGNVVDKRAFCAVHLTPLLLFLELDFRTTTRLD